jgi:DNA-binding HxlR family transcriptional regulator
MHDAIQALAKEMARHGTDRDAPVRSVMALLGDRWTTLILLVLAGGELRHAELKRVLATLSSEQAISQRVLTLKLRTLERDGFVARAVTADVPPKVSYCLTPLGQELHSQARGMIDWIKSGSAAIAAARRRFDDN